MLEQAQQLRLNPVFKHIEETLTDERRLGKTLVYGTAPTSVGTVLAREQAIGEIRALVRFKAELDDLVRLAEEQVKKEKKDGPY